jgi:hypothetical protein
VFKTSISEATKMKLKYFLPLLLTGCASVDPVPAHLQALQDHVDESIEYQTCGNNRAPEFMPFKGCCRDYAFSKVLIAQKSGYQAVYHTCYLNKTVGFAPNSNYRGRAQVGGAGRDRYHAVAIINDKWVLDIGTITSKQNSACTNLW